MPDPRYPIGRFSFDDPVNRGDLERHLTELAALPAALRQALAGHTDAELRATYRDGGWSIRQLVHHLADSHLNGYIRHKLALSEDTPTIKPYLEGPWAELPDVATTPIEVSLDLLEALHRRWSDLLGALRPADFQRGYIHPEHDLLIPLDRSVASYAWHGRHHTAHVLAARARGRV